MFATETGQDIRKAKEFLEAGEVVAIPTETVYGLAGNALSEDAVLKIFAVKERPFFDPLIVHTHSKGEIEKYTEAIPPVAHQLIDRFMPGPLTVLLKKKKIIPDLVTSGLDNVAIRIPNHSLTLALLKELDFPLAAPSANPFGYISPTTARHVSDQLNGKIPYILDGGPAQVGVESTIVGFENDEVLIYRLGGVTVEDIRQVTNRVIIRTQSDSNPGAPGMLKSHYAPKKPMILWGSDLSRYNPERVCVIVFDSYVAGIPEKNQVLLSPSGNINEAAKNLFSVMRRLDQAEADVIVAVPFPDHGLGRAINDRINRACA